MGRFVWPLLFILGLGLLVAAPRFAGEPGNEALGTARQTSVTFTAAPARSGSQDASQSAQAAIDEAIAAQIKAAVRPAELAEVGRLLARAEDAAPGGVAPDAPADSPAVRRPGGSYAAETLSRQLRVERAGDEPRIEITATTPNAERSGLLATLVAARMVERQAVAAAQARRNGAPIVLAPQPGTGSDGDAQEDRGTAGDTPGAQAGSERNDGTAVEAGRTSAHGPVDERSGDPEEGQEASATRQAQRDDAGSAARPQDGSAVRNDALGPALRRERVQSRERTRTAFDGTPVEPTTPDERGRSAAQRIDDEQRADGAPQRRNEAPRAVAASRNSAQTQSTSRDRDDEASRRDAARPKPREREARAARRASVRDAADVARVRRRVPRQIRQLMARQARVRRYAQRLSRHLGPRHPDMKAARRAVRRVDATLARAVRRWRADAQTEGQALATEIGRGKTTGQRTGPLRAQLPVRKRAPGHALDGLQRDFRATPERAEHPGRPERPVRAVRSLKDSRWKLPWLISIEHLVAQATGQPPADLRPSTGSDAAPIEGAPSGRAPATADVPVDARVDGPPQPVAPDLMQMLPFAIDERLLSLLGAIFAGIAALALAVQGLGWLGARFLARNETSAKGPRSPLTSSPLTRSPITRRAEQFTGPRRAPGEAKPITRATGTPPLAVLGAETLGATEVRTCIARVDLSDDIRLQAGAITLMDRVAEQVPEAGPDAEHRAAMALLVGDAPAMRRVGHAINLAVAAIARGRRPLLVDADGVSRGLTRALALEQDGPVATPSVFDLVSGVAILDDAANWIPGCELAVVPLADGSAGALSPIDLDLLGEIAHDDDFDLVIVDGPDLLAIADGIGADRGPSTRPHFVVCEDDARARGPDTAEVGPLASAFARVHGGAVTAVTLASGTQPSDFDTPEMVRSETDTPSAHSGRSAQRVEAGRLDADAAVASVGGDQGELVRPRVQPSASVDRIRARLRARARADRRAQISATEGAPAFLSASSQGVGDRAAAALNAVAATRQRVLGDVANRVEAVRQATAERVAKSPAVATAARETARRLARRTADLAVEQASSRAAAAADAARRMADTVSGSIAGASALGAGRLGGPRSAALVPSAPSAQARAATQLQGRLRRPPAAQPSQGASALPRAGTNDMVQAETDEAWALNDDGKPIIL